MCPLKQQGHGQGLFWQCHHDVQLTSSLQRSSTNRVHMSIPVWKQPRRGFASKQAHETAFNGSTLVVHLMVPEHLKLDGSLHRFIYSLLCSNKLAHWPWKRGRRNHSMRSWKLWVLQWCHINWFKKKYFAYNSHWQHLSNSIEVSYFLA